jgi:predicted phage tail protein
MSNGLTEKQQRALEHLERARSAGMSLSDYARAQGVEVRPIYDSMAALRKKGMLTPATPRADSAFVAVRVRSRSEVSEPAPTISGGSLICRLRIGAAVIECAEWPPASWLAALASARADATA